MVINVHITGFQNYFPFTSLSSFPSSGKVTFWYFADDFVGETRMSDSPWTRDSSSRGDHKGTAAFPPSYSLDNSAQAEPRMDVGNRELSVRTSRSITRDSRMLHSCTLPSARHRYRRAVLTRVLESGSLARRAIALEVRLNGRSKNQSSLVYNNQV